MTIAVSSNHNTQLCISRYKLHHIIFLLVFAYYLIFLRYHFFLCLDIFSLFFFFFSSRRRHTRSLRDWSSDVCSSDLRKRGQMAEHVTAQIRDDALAQRGHEIVTRGAGQREHSRNRDHHAEIAVDQEIGRASCRERV